MKKVLLMFIACASIVTYYACSKSSSSPDPAPGGGTGFDKTAMLTNYADNLIVPGYSTMQQKITLLQTASEAFLVAPSVTTQTAFKAAYVETHLQYERIAAFQFGPAESALLDIFLNYSGGLDYSFTTAGQLTGFSIDSVTIETNITSGTYNFESMTRNSFYSQGFPALNYIFLGPNAISKFSANTTNRVKYAKDVITRIKTLVDKVATGWTTYRTEFIANTKTNTGSPIANLVNQFAYQMDLLKGPRTGWPFGKQSNGQVFATKVEAYFTNNSTALAIENLTALKNTYTGGGNGKGLSDYLVSLGKSTLNTDVLAQFDIALAKLKLIPDPLSASLTSQSTAVEAAYKEIQKLLTLLKTDVASATAVQITFMDNDGD